MCVHACPLPLTRGTTLSSALVGTSPGLWARLPECLLGAGWCPAESWTRAVLCPLLWVSRLPWFFLKVGSWVLGDVF